MRSRILTLLVALTLVATACGDDTAEVVDDPGTTAPSSVPTTVMPTTTVVPTTSVPPTTSLQLPDGPVPVVAGGGSSFGECAGLCVGELRIEGPVVSLERRSWDSALGVLAEGELTDEGLDRLRAVEIGLFAVELEETYGCPDCADGGAAWIDVVPVPGAARSTYELGNPPDELADWEGLRRALSDALATCTSDGLVAVAAGCETEPGDPDSPRRIVGGGFTFGMCAGYCLTEVAVDDATVSLTRQAWADITGEDLPVQVVVGELTETGRRALADLEAAVAPATLQATYGCPDCADGGAGWVTLRDRGTDRRSTFEYGDPPPELAGIDEFFSGLMATLRECGTDEVVTTGPDCVPADDPR